MYPPMHEKPEKQNSFERLEMLWKRYPKYHERTTFARMEDLLEEHESWQEDFTEELREEYDSGGYGKFLVQLSWADLPYRYAAKEAILEAGDPEPNPYVEAFLEEVMSDAF